MIFEFDQQPVFMQNIDIDDIGNMALRCSTTAGKEYYIVVKTYLGKTAMIKYGPLYSEVDSLVENLDLAFKKFDYKESTISREISKFLNDGRNSITKVELITESEGLAYLPTASMFQNSL